MSPPNLRARCQKWTICSVPGGRFAFIFLCFLVPLLLAARLSARLIRLDKKKCVIFASCPHHCCFVIRLLFCVGEHESQCALCVSSSSRIEHNVTGCHCRSHTVTPYCVAIMGILSCHTIINTLTGKCIVFAMHPRVLGY